MYWINATVQQMRFIKKSVIRQKQFGIRCIRRTHIVFAIRKVEKKIYFTTSDIIIIIIVSATCWICKKNNLVVFYLHLLTGF